VCKLPRLLANELTILLLLKITSHVELSRLLEFPTRRELRILVVGSFNFKHLLFPALSTDRLPLEWTSLVIDSSISGNWNKWLVWSQVHFKDSSDERPVIQTHSLDICLMEYSFLSSWSCPLLAFASCCLACLELLLVNIVEDCCSSLSSTGSCCKTPKSSFFNFWAIIENWFWESRLLAQFLTFFIDLLFGRASLWKFGLFK